MPQLDLDHLFCVGGARSSSGFTDSSMSMSKVACETTAAAALPAGAGAVELRASPGGGAGDAADDAPAESVLVRISDGVCLPHLCGAALRRDGSTKGSSNPKAAAEAATRKGAPSAADGPRRSLVASPPATKTAVVIGVLPAASNKERRVRVPGRAWRLPVPVPVAGGARVFASEAVHQGPEPVSPKVSCFGAVLSERSPTAAPFGKQEEEEGSGGGCWASLGAALLGQLSVTVSEPNSKQAIGMAPPEPEPQRVAVMLPPPLQLPVAGLGDVKRLASRRWPETIVARGTV